MEETLKPKAQAMGNGLTWEGMLGDLQPKQPWPTDAKLTAYAMYDGKYTNEKAGEMLRTSYAFIALLVRLRV